MHTYREKYFGRILAGVAGFALSVGNATAGPATVEEIRAEYTSVAEEKLTAFEIPFEMEEIGGTLTLRYNGGEIRSAVAEFGHEHWGNGISFYYKDGEPFFILFEESGWKFVGEEETEDSVVETRYYVANGKVIRILRKEYKGRGDEDLKAAAVKAENRPAEVGAEDVALLLKKARLIIAARNGAHVAKILLAGESG